MNWDRIGKFFKNYLALIIVIMAALLFAAATGSFNYLTQDYSESGDFVKWASPDESANYIFAKLYGQEGRIGFEESYNRYSRDVMHPRSFRSDHGQLKPVSFLGIILIYGQIVSLTTYKLLPFLTPIIGGLGIVFFYLLVKEVFGRPNALISALLLASFPPYVYYSVRSMFHNVLFTVLVVIAAYFAVKAVKTWQKRPFFRDFFRLSVKRSEYAGWIMAALFGLFLGLAALTRTSELLWLLPAWVLFGLFNLRRLSLAQLAISACFFGLAILPMFYHNTILYGSPILGGYAEMNNSIAAVKDAGAAALRARADNGFFATLADKVFHFGFDFKQSLRMLKYYYADMFPLYWWLMLGGLILLFFEPRAHGWRAWQWLAVSGLFSVILVLYYGSWEFFDNPDQSARTIGNSYTRYWLPVYLSHLPLVSFFVLSLTRNISRFHARLDRAWFRWLGRAAVIIFIAFYSVKFVLAGSEEGLLRLYSQQIAAQAEQQRLLGLTETNAVVITRYHDKLLFPERKVIVGLFDDPAMNAIYARLLNYLPVYYYNFNLPPRDIEYLNGRRLKESGLGIEEVAPITDTFTLYRLYPVRESAGHNE